MEITDEEKVLRILQNRIYRVSAPASDPSRLHDVTFWDELGEWLSIEEAYKVLKEVDRGCYLWKWECGHWKIEHTDIQVLIKKN